MRRFLLPVLLSLSFTVFAADKKPAFTQATGAFFALLVPNAEEASHWYQEKLGLEFVRKGTGPNGASHTIMLRGEGISVEIIEHRDSFALSRVTSKHADLLRGIRRVGLQLTPGDFDRLMRRLKEQDVEFIGGVFQDSDLHQQSFIVRDNAGNLLQFFTDMPSESR